MYILLEQIYEIDIVTKIVLAYIFANFVEIKYCIKISTFTSQRKN